MPKREETPKVHRRDPLSGILRHFSDVLEQEDEAVTVARVLLVFGVRGIAFLLFVLALMNVVIFMIPGLSILFGLPMIILAVQMILGLPAPVFPRVLLARTLDRDLLLKGLEIGLKITAWIEHFIKPRLLVLSRGDMTWLYGLWALVLAVMISFPIPFVNIPPSIAMIFLGLGLLQRDGLLLIGSYLMGAWSLWLFDSLRGAAQQWVG